MKEIDETPLPENESVIVDLLVLETWIALWADNLRLIERLETLEVEVADLHHRRRVSRQQATDQDPEWH